MPRIFEQGADVDPILTHRVAWGLAGNPTKNSTWAKILAWFQSNLTFPPTSPTVQTLESIGDWNMNSSGSGVFFLNVAHNVADFKKIRRITAYVRNDADDTYYMLNAVAGSTATTLGGVASWDATDVVLVAATGENFDNVNFSTTTYNRGHLVIETIP